MMNFREAYRFQPIHVQAWHLFLNCMKGTLSQYYQWSYSRILKEVQYDLRAMILCPSLTFCDTNNILTFDVLADLEAVEQYKNLQQLSFVTSVYVDELCLLSYPSQFGNMLYSVCLLFPCSGYSILYHIHFFHSYVLLYILFFAFLFVLFFLFATFFYTQLFVFCDLDSIDFSHLRGRHWIFLHLLLCILCMLAEAHLSLCSAWKNIQWWQDRNLGIGNTFLRWGCCLEEKVVRYSRYISYKVYPCLRLFQQRGGKTMFRSLLYHTIVYFATYRILFTKIFCPYHRACEYLQK